MTRRKSHLKRNLIVPLLVAAALLLAISSAFALNSMLRSWEDLYPHSASGDASCSTCHGSGTSNLNAYGKDLCLQFGGSIPADITQDLVAIQSFDSDGDGTSNLAEISAGSQPGWTTGPNLLYYGLDVGCVPTGAAISVPASVPVPYDPPEGGAPVAVTGGPYEGNVDVPITFDGSESYDSDGGSIASYVWNFGDGSSGTGMTSQHAYAAPGSYVVTLTVVDNDGKSSSSSTSAVISGEPVLDLDIASFRPRRTGRVGRALALKLSVENKGSVLGQAIATIVGEQNGVEVYRWRLNVYDYIGKRSTSFTFPSYTPVSKGKINWTATIADVDPDVDKATATTTVK